MPLVHHDWFFLIAPLTSQDESQLFFPPTTVTTSKSVAPYTMMNTAVTVLPSLHPSTGEGVTSLQEPREIQSHFSAMIRFVGSVLLPLAFYLFCKELQLHGILLHALLIATVFTAWLQWWDLGQTFSFLVPISLWDVYSWYPLMLNMKKMKTIWRKWRQNRQWRKSGPEYGSFSFLLCWSCNTCCYCQ